MKLIKYTIALLATIVLVHITQFASATTWAPEGDCRTGCVIEIFDHDGVTVMEDKDAVYRVKNPVVTAAGDYPPYLDLYNPTLADIKNCVFMVEAIEKPRPGSITLKAREFTLAGSDIVVFLIDPCDKFSVSVDVPGKFSGKVPGKFYGKVPGKVPVIVPGKVPGGVFVDIPGDGDSSDSSDSCSSGDTHEGTTCTESGSGWLSVTNTLSEDDCQLGYTDAHMGAGQRVIYDNSYSVTCNGSSHEPSVYIGTSMGDSNWGYFNDPSEACRMQVESRPSDSTMVVKKIICPSTPK